MISEPLNYYDEQVIALDMSRLYAKEKALLADMLKRQAAAHSMAEQKQVFQEYQSNTDVVEFSNRKAEIIRRQNVCQNRKEAAKHTV